MPTKHVVHGEKVFVKKTNVYLHIIQERGHDDEIRSDKLNMRRVATANKSNIGFMMRAKGNTILQCYIYYEARGDNRYRVTSVYGIHGGTGLNR